MERQLGVALVDRSPTRLAAHRRGGAGHRLGPAGRGGRGGVRRGRAGAAGPAGLPAAGRGEHDDRRVPAARLAARAARRSGRTPRCPCSPGTRRSWPSGLLAGEADLGFVEGLSVPDGLDSAVIAHDRLIVVTAPGPSVGPAPAGARRGGAGGHPADPAGEGLGHPAGPGRGPRRAGPPPDRAVLHHGGEGGRGRAAPGPPSSANWRWARNCPPAGWSRSLWRASRLSRELRAVWPVGHRPTGPARDLLALTRG